jgi:hypothetical protein
MTLVLVLAEDSIWNEVNAFAAVAAALVAIAALIVTQMWTIFHKKLDVTMHFQEAYATLEKEKIQVHDWTDAKSWFRRYWNLQIRQYEYWLHGYIRDEIYVYWMHCNKLYYDFPSREFLFYDAFGKPKLIKYDYSKGWNAVKDDVVLVQHPYYFKQFIEGVLAHKQAATFARCILDVKKDLFGWSAKLDRMTDQIICDDPRKLFRLRKRACCPPCNANVVPRT